MKPLFDVQNHGGAQPCHVKGVIAKNTATSLTEKAKFGVSTVGISKRQESRAKADSSERRASLSFVDQVPEWFWKKLSTEERTLLYRCEKAIEDEVKYATRR